MVNYYTLIIKITHYSTLKSNNKIKIDYHFLKIKKAARTIKKKPTR